MSSPEAIKVNARTFHHLSAGSTTILPNGKVLRFGGAVERVEGGTRVGQGTIVTDDVEEINWLEHLTKQKPPQVWEEKPEAPTEIPAAVKAGVPADKKMAAEELSNAAVRSTSPEVLAVQAKLGTLAATSDGGAQVGITGNSQNMAPLAGSSN